MQSTSSLQRGISSRSLLVCLGLKRLAFLKTSSQVGAVIYRATEYSLLSVLAFQALVVYGEVKKGGNVLVHAGASGVGIAAIQLARVYGASVPPSNYLLHGCHSNQSPFSPIHRLTVTATASTQEKLDWLLSIPNGATNAANYKTQNFAEEVKKVTGGNGADVIIDFVGQSHWNHNIDALAVDGRMTMLSFLSGKHACVKIVLIMETVHPFRSDSSFGEPRPNSIQAPSDYRLYSSVPLSCLSGRPHRTVRHSPQ